MAPFFSVLIVNYNGGAFLGRCLDAVLAQEGPRFEAILIDNGSTDGSLANLPDDPRLRIIEAGENLGFAAANNRAAEQATGDWIVTLNPDAYARPGWLGRLGTRDASPSRRGHGSAPCRSWPIRPTCSTGRGDEFSAWSIAYRARYGHGVQTMTDDYPVFGPCAAAAAYRRELFEAVCGFDERFFCYHEDVDLALRLRGRGERCVQVVDAVVDHVGGGISGDASDFAVYHGTRNRIWTWFSSMPTALLWGLLPLMLASNLAYLLWSAVRSRRFRPTARGLWHGFRGAPAMLRTRASPPGFGTVLNLLTWSPLAVIRRRNRMQR